MQRHGVDMRKRDGSDASQPGLAAMMEGVFAHTDRLCESADIGAPMLFGDVSDVIGVARIMYPKIHDEIRLNDYRIFDGRVKVSLSRKLAVVLEHVPRRELAHTATVELYFLAGRRRKNGVLASVRADGQERREARAHVRRTAAWASLLAFVALVYSTPWDNYLVPVGIWGYGGVAVIGAIGLVPVGEYAFFVTGTRMAGDIWLPWI